MYDGLVVVDHGFLPIDKIPPRMPCALGRWAEKNGNFSARLQPKNAPPSSATLMENCRMQHIDPFAYLLDTVAALQHGCTDFSALMPRDRALAADRAAG